MIKKIQKELFALQDPAYRSFQSKLMPTVDKSAVIGVRTPLLRKFSKTIIGTDKEEAFLEALPHTYYDENNLHALIIKDIKDYDRCIRELDAFLPYVDNWATCDMMSPNVLKNDLDRLYEKILLWLTSDRVYTVRFAIKCLMDFYLDDSFREDVLSLVADVRHEDYYVKMCCAWFFATALTKQYERALPYLTRHRLSPWVHNKAIQKATESLCIDEKTKEYLKTLKVKSK